LSIFSTNLSNATRITVVDDGGSSFKSLYAVDGSIQVTVVLPTETSFVGTYALDGSLNVTLALDSQVFVGNYAPNGSKYITLDSDVKNGAMYVEVVSDTLGMLPIDLLGRYSNLITTTRSGDTGTYFDKNGILRVALANTSRFTYENGYLELLSEEARTNSLRNSTMVGAAVPSTMPTNWFLSTNGGLTETITGVGTVNGMDYIDIRLSGTPTGTSYVRYFDSTTQVTAAATEVWTGSFYTSLVDGSLSNLTFRSGMVARTAAGVFVANNNITEVPTANLRRVTNTYTMPATTERVQFGFLLTLTVGVAVDATFRIVAPQLELGNSASTFVPTSTIAVARSADRHEVTGSNFSSIWPILEGSIVVDFLGHDVLASKNVFDISDGTSNERINVATTSGSAISTVITDGAVSVFNQTGAVLSANTRYKFGLAFKLNDSNYGLNGVLGTNDTSVTLPTVDRMMIGANRAFTGTTIPNGRYRRFWLFKRRVTNGELSLLIA